MAQVKKSIRQGDEAVGKSKGGKSIKVQASVDAFGNPRRLILTPGQAHDVRTGPALIKGEDTEAVIADKAYDSEEFLVLIAQMGLRR